MSESVYTIEKNVPLPPISRTRAGGRTAKYPFASMEVNDYIPVDYGDEDQKKVTRRVRTAVLVFHRNKANKEKKFSVRQVEAGAIENHPIAHVGVWRIE